MTNLFALFKNNNTIVIKSIPFGKEGSRFSHSGLPAPENTLSINEKSHKHIKNVDENSIILTQ